MTLDTLTTLTAYVSNKRRRFDPKKKTDMLALAYFRKNNKWENGCPFYLEWPYTDIVSMCLSRYADSMFAKM